MSSSAAGRSPLVTTAIHAGHELRTSLHQRTSLDDAVRLREEDPFTDRLTSDGGPRVVVRRSRFEVDLNRPRDAAVYLTAEHAWGLTPWKDDLPAAEIEASLAHYDEFYAQMARALDQIAATGPFVVLDLHSYNHRRGGPDAPPEPEEENPEVNVGTGTVDRSVWVGLVDRFIDAMSTSEVNGHTLDVRENVRFRGGNFSRWVNERYDGTGCALAVEFKKTFMDEWTGAVDEDHLGQLRAALAVAETALLDEVSHKASR